METSTKIKITKYDRFLLEPFRFVIQAVAKENTRYKISYVLIENNYIVATDGKRMHYAYFPNPLTDRYEAGLYEIMKATKTNIVLLKVDTEIQFPTWQAVIPHYNTYFDLLDRYSYAEIENSFIGVVLASLGKYNIGLNYNFLKPFGLCDRRWRVFYSGEDNTRPVRFVSYENNIRLEAVLMPVNLCLSDIKFRTKSWRRKYAA